jgi:hypothetical protein
MIGSGVTERENTQSTGVGDRDMLVISCGDPTTGTLVARGTGDATGSLVARGIGDGDGEMVWRCDDTRPSRCDVERGRYGTGP